MNSDPLDFDFESIQPPTHNEDDGGMEGVLEALLELHQLEARENTFKNYERDHTTINKAISLNERLQKQVLLQIEFIDKQLDSNAKTMTEARYSANAENRFGQRLYLHRPYDTKINYFDNSELIQSEQTPAKDTQEEEDEEEQYPEDEDEEEDSTDSEKRLPNKAWSLKERQKLMAGIISEARRAIAYDHLKKGEGWRVWDVEKIDKGQLENFPVSRLDWSRISSVHVHSRTANQCLMQWTTQEHPIINKKPWSKQESEQLSQLVNEIGHGQWEKIANELGTNRTISQCFSHYMADKNHKLARSLKWTPEEDKRLSLAVKIFGNCNWQQVAGMLKGRTGQQCLHRWAKSINPAITRSRWSPEESELLKRAVKLYGEGNWSKVQRLLPGRTDMQCRERFVNIEMAVNKSKMTEEELNQLVALVNEVGPKWSYIASFFPGRTDNFMFKEYHHHINKDEREAKQKERAPKAKAPKKTPKPKTPKPKKTPKAKTPKAKKIPKGRKRTKPDLEKEVEEEEEIEEEEEEEIEEEEEEEVVDKPKNKSKRKRRRVARKESGSDSDTEDEYKPPIIKLNNNARGVLTRRQKQQLQQQE